MDDKLNLNSAFTTQTLADVSILVVDDYPAIRKGTKLFLEGAGFKNIHLAEDGVAALELLASTPIDVVVSDYEMPRMNGIDLVKAIRADERLKDLPVLITSGTLGIDIAAFKAGANEFVTKGRDLDALIGKITQLAEQALAKALHSAGTVGVTPAGPDAKP